MKLSPLLITAATTTLVHGLWPLPPGAPSGSNGTSASALKLGGSFSISGPDGAPEDLSGAIQRSRQHLQSDKLAALTVSGGAEYTDQVKSAPELTSLKLSYTGGSSNGTLSEESVMPIGERSEAYKLTVPKEGGEATLEANSSLGLFRGLATFEQMWYDLSNTTYTLLGGLAVEDKPAYPYRGLMLDTARNYFPVADIKRTIDAMSLVKLNVFHWHIVDSQSFPLVLPGLESLSDKGAYNTNGGVKQVYTAEDVKDVVSYASARGISVLPEIDTPGHTSVISKAFPEHVACAEKTPWATYANEPPAGQLRFTSSDTVNFTTSMLTAAADLFTMDMFSTGGDEINQKCYSEDQQFQSDLQSSGKTFTQALQDFTDAEHSALFSKGKKAVVWEEMVLDQNLTLPQNSTTVMVWISSANAASVANKGYKLVHAPSDYFYLDCGHGGWVGDFPTGNSWCDPFKTWQKAYTFDPLANITDPSMVLGGQALLWTEQSNPSALDSTLWPRAASAAEVFWSGGGGDVQAALPRLHDLAYRLNQRGIGAIALQPHWCAVRPGACDLTA